MLSLQCNPGRQLGWVEYPDPIMIGSKTKTTTFYTAWPAKACSLVDHRPHTWNKARAPVRLRYYLHFLLPPSSSKGPLLSDFHLASSFPSTLWPHPQCLWSNHSFPCPTSRNHPILVPVSFLLCQYCGTTSALSLRCPNSVAIVSRLCLIVKSHQEDGDDSFSCDDVIQRWDSHVPTSQTGDDHCAAATPSTMVKKKRR